MDRSVTLIQQGREGQLCYREGQHCITGHQEFGGGNVIAVVSMGSEGAWRERHPWAVGRRAQILRYIGDEMIRQQAPSCVTEIDATSGDIVLRGASGGAVAGEAAGSRGREAAPVDVSWVRRYGRLKGRLGLIGLLVVLLALGMAWALDRAGRLGTHSQWQGSSKQ
jgi:hypothetical protein